MINDKPEMLIRCRDCGSTLFYKTTGEGYEVFHSCKDGKHVRELLLAAVKDARREAYLDAAKIAEDESLRWSLGGSFWGVASDIAEAIRKRVSEL